MSDEDPITFTVTGGPTWLPPALVMSALKADALGPEELMAEIVDLCNAWALMAYIECPEEGLRWGWQAAEMLVAAMKTGFADACQERGGQETIEKAQDEWIPEIKRVLEQGRADLERKLAELTPEDDDEPPQDILWQS